MSTQDNFRNNEADKRFELDVEGHTAIMEYSMTDDIIIISHTEVPQALEGRGVGKQLAEKVLHYIDEKKWRLMPLCPFVSAYIKRHPEWEYLVLKHG